MGSIRKVNDTYQVDFYLGSYRFRKNLASRDEAQHLLRIIEAKIVTKESTVSDAIALYLRNVSSLKSKKSHDIDVSILSRLAMGVSGEWVSSISAHHLEDLRSGMIKEGIANTSINRYFNTLKHFFRKCEEWGFILRSPAKFIRALPNDAKPRSSWLSHEIAVVRIFLSPQYRAVFDLLTFTGARLSQILNLKVSDVDLSLRLMTFRSKKGPRAQEKSYKVPISHDALEILKNAVKGKRDDDYLFVSNQGSPIKPSLFSKNFTRMLKRKDLTDKRLTLHGLRHTFASNLSRKGAPINDIRLLLGHSTTKVTEGYIHSNVEQLRKYLK